MKILMVIPSAIGHLNPSFFISKVLTKAGHEVVYLATPDAINTIRRNGFNYISSPIVLFSGETPFNSKIGFWERCAKRLTGFELKFTRSNGELFIEAVNTFEPDIILLDSIISYNYLYLRKRFSVVLLQTMLSTNEDNTPPLTSSLVPSNSIWSTVLIKYEWAKYYVRAKFLSWTLLGDTQFGIIKRIFKYEAKDFDKLFIKRKTFQYGLVNVKEIILSPASIDFSHRVKRKNQYYAGLCLDKLFSVDPDLDTFKCFLNTLSVENKLIYCSLGTLSQIHFSKLEQFYKKLINVFRKRQEYLIISFGDFDKLKLGQLPNNVYTFKSVPQKYLLSKVNMMITHAGLNSVLECIYYEVPMLAFPLNHIWDQNGNAARIVYHGLGMRGSIKNISEVKLNSLISLVIDNSDFKKNIKRMRHNFEHDTTNVDITNLIVETFKEFKNECR